MKRLLPLLLACLLLLCSCTGETSGSSLSRGIDYLISKNKLEKCTVSNRSLMFDAQEFEAACGGNLSYAVIATLPDESVGTLTLSGEVVRSGQTLTASELSYLRFTPCGTAGSYSKFSVICCNGYGVDSTVNCSITLTEFENKPPVAYDLDITAISGVPKSGTLSFGDPDGDTLTLSIDSYPSHGCVDILQSGSFVYTPDIGYTGADNMKFTVTDRFGASSCAVLNINVTGNPKALVFEDVDSDMQYDCVSACLSEIMTYRLEEGKYIFSPDEEINRIDFLVMLMTACGINDIYSVKDTVFEDDGLISDGRKAYLAKAAEIGIVDISSEFKPFEKVTRAQASVWLARALGLPDIKSSAVCADISEAPAWATASVKAVISSGIMQTYRGYFMPNATVTKSLAANIFSCVGEYKSTIVK